MRLAASSERERIDRILATPPEMTVWDRLTLEISGIEIVERRHPEIEAMLMKDCASYVVERLGLTYEELFRITHLYQPIKGYREIPRLQSGVLVAYYTPSDDLTQRHFGVGSNAEEVISKWNIGHVFCHPVGLVEGMYTEVKFFTNQFLKR